MGSVPGSAREGGQRLGACESAGLALLGLDDGVGAMRDSGFGDHLKSELFANEKPGGGKAAPKRSRAVIAAEARSWRTLWP